ncbi:MAG: cation acetate symporter [Aeromicrobium sp.]
MSTAAGLIAVIAVSLATVAIGAFGLRVSRTTSDFYVASRTVRPLANASAISGEYLSAASFLGVAGLILAHGVDALWFPVGFTAGYLVLLVFVAAPLRRSGAYTIPDFAEVRLQSSAARYTASLLVVGVSWFYLMPQFQGAGLTLRTATGAPSWVGSVLVAIIVVINVVSGGMRSITFVQAFQYWLKLSAMLIPLFFLIDKWRGDGSPAISRLHAADWVEPLAGPNSIYLTYSIILATFLGTMGLPHVVVRFYTNPDGRAARRTTLIVLALIGSFYLMPTIYGALGRIYSHDLIAGGRTDAVVLELPGRMLGGTTGDILSALLTAGAFAAFLSTSSGLTMSIAGVVGQDLVGTRLGKGLSGITALRLAVIPCILVPLIPALATERLAVASSVTFAFALAASTFCPLLVLGIWWRSLTARGAIAGLIAGGLCAGIAPILTIAAKPEGWVGVMLSQPAAWSVPIGFAVMIVGSMADRNGIPANVARTMVRLHTPERIDVDRRI